MNDLFSEAAELQKLLESESREFFFVGGIALQIWGEPRLTTDIDLTIFTNLKDETEQIKHFLTLYKSRFKDPNKALEFARTKRVVLLETPSKTGIDLMLSGLSDLSSDLKRSSYQKFASDISLKICSADTLIAYKTVAGRLKDFADIESVIIKQGRNLDWNYIDEYLNLVSEYRDISLQIAKLTELRGQRRRP